MKYVDEANRKTDTNSLHIHQKSCFPISCFPNSIYQQNKKHKAYPDAFTRSCFPILPQVCFPIFNLFPTVSCCFPMGNSFFFGVLTPFSSYCFPFLLLNCFPIKLPLFPTVTKLGNRIFGVLTLFTGSCFPVSHVSQFFYTSFS